MKYSKSHKKIVKSFINAFVASCVMTHSASANSDVKYKTVDTTINAQTDNNVDEKLIIPTHPYRKYHLSDKKISNINGFKGTNL